MIQVNKLAGKISWEANHLTLYYNLAGAHPEPCEDETIPDGVFRPCAIQGNASKQECKKDFQTVTRRSNRYEKKFYHDPLRHAHIVEHKRILEDTRGVL